MIFTGRLPKYMDAKKDSRPGQLAEKCRYAAFCANELLNSLENCRLVEVRDARGIRADNLIYQMRNDGSGRWLFLSHVNRMKNQDIPKPVQNTIILDGYWDLTLYDTLTGETRKLESVKYRGKTNITMTLYEHDSLLLYMEPLAPVTDQADTAHDGGKTLSLGEEAELENIFITPD